MNLQDSNLHIKELKRLLKGASTPEEIQVINRLALALAVCK